MVILRPSENLDDPILQEEQTGGVVSRLLQEVSALELLPFEVVDDIVESIVADVLEVGHSLNTSLDKALHSVIIREDCLLEL